MVPPRSSALVGLMTLGLLGMMVSTATPASAADCSFGVAVTTNNFTCSIPTGVTAIKVEVLSTAGGARSNPTVAGGAGAAISAWTLVQTGDVLKINIGYDGSGTCTFGDQDNQSAASGQLAAVLFATNTSSAVVAGGGGAPGCAESSVGSGSGGAAGVPTGSGVADGITGGNGGAGGQQPVTGGFGGSATQGQGGQGSETIGSNDGQPGVADGTNSYLSKGGAPANVGVRGGSGGPGHTGGGSGGSGRANVDAGGGGGGSSFIGIGWNFISAAARSSTTGASVTITNYTSIANNADLSSLSTSAGALSPPFAAGTTVYSMSVDNDVVATTLTPTVAQSGATVTVNGAGVTSGSPSSSVSLDVGITSVDVVVTALDGTTTKTYTIQFNRGPAPPPGGLPGPTDEENRQLTVSNPIAIPTGLRSNSSVVQETLQGEATGIIALRNSTNSGWNMESGGGSTSISATTATGQPSPLALSGALRVSPGASLDISSSGYKPGTVVYVYAIPQNQAANGSGTSGSVYLAAFTVGTDGSISGTVAIPRGMNPGDFVLQINGISASQQIRSINLAMTISLEASVTPPSQFVNAAFFRSRSSELSVNGRRKLEEFVQSLPNGAVVNQVVVVGVSKFDKPVSYNTSLATARADELVRFLDDRGVVDNRDTVRFLVITDDRQVKTLGFDSQGQATPIESPGALESAAPATSSSGKSLSTVRVTYQSN